MQLFVVYDHSKDYPSEFVVREFYNETPKEIVLRSKRLDVIRYSLLSRGLVKLERFPEDDPKILEIWI